MITIDEITTREAFDALRAEWHALAAALRGSTPFDDPSWYACCLAADPRRPLASLAARRDGALVGVAPWWAGRSRIRGIAARTLGFIAHRETPQSGFVVRPDVREDVIAAFMRHARGPWRGRWDVMTLAPWPADSPDLAALGRLAPSARYRTHLGRASVVPSIAIATSWDDFLDGKSYLFRKSRRGILNRMSRVPDVTMERIRRSPGPNLLEELAHVSRLGWKHQDGVSLAAREDSLRFFAALNDAASAEGWLDLWMLRFGGVPVAFEYDLQHDGVIYALRAEFDGTHDKLSPGAYLEYFILKSAFDEGRRVYSCGPGLDTYKLRWTDSQHENVATRIYGSTAAGRGLELLEERLVPALRRLRDAVRPARSATPGAPDAEPEPAPAPAAGTKGKG